MKSFAARTAWLTLAFVGLVGFTATDTLRSADTDDPPALTLNERIDQILKSKAAQTAFWGIEVVNLKTGQTVYSRNGDMNLVPASGQKLLTTAAALDALSAGHRYQTGLYFNGEIVDETLKGDLILKGAGDPTFGSRLLRRDPLGRWAKELATAGIKRIEGRIIGDDSSFEDGLYPGAWILEHISTQAYASGVSALSYADNLVKLTVTGSAKGGVKPKIRVFPNNHLEIVNYVSTTKRRTGAGIRIRRDPGSNQVVVSGTIQIGHSQTLSIPTADPAGYALATFEGHLRRAGIEVAAALTKVDAIGGTPRYDTASLLFVNVSPPLNQIVRVINKSSNNFFAEHVYRTIGGDGSTVSSRSRIRDLLSRSGASARTVSIRDGSGLSRKNLVSAKAMASLLSYMFVHEEGGPFVESLAIGGEDGTTLRRRLDDQLVQAKTGTLEFVSTLSGYTYARDSTPLAFSIMANNYSTNTGTIRSIQDQIVRTLAR